MCEKKVKNGKILSEKTVLRAEKDECIRKLYVQKGLKERRRQG